jgi:hypothetical protein
MTTERKKKHKQHKLTIDLGMKLLGECEKLRRVFQADLGEDVSVSRGDVVRVALWRLKLDVMAYLAKGQDAANDHMFFEWMDAAAILQVLSKCPGWLCAKSSDRPKYYPPKGKDGAK